MSRYTAAAAHITLNRRRFSAPATRPQLIGVVRDAQECAAMLSTAVMLRSNPVAILYLEEMEAFMSIVSVWLWKIDGTMETLLVSLRGSGLELSAMLL